MCDVCKSEKVDYVSKCGIGHSVNQRVLYRVFVGKPALINVCRLHDIELFQVGEKRFLEKNRPFLKALSKKRHKFIS